MVLMAVNELPLINLRFWLCCDMHFKELMLMFIILINKGSLNNDTVFN